MKINEILNKTIVQFLILGLFLAPCCAQKLPNVQETGMRVPGTVKIDGKIDEWGGKLQAFNDRVTLFYTIANDEDNIYLVVHCTNSLIIKKIINGGLSFSINVLHKKEKGSVSVLYPFVSRADYDKALKSLPEGVSNGPNNDKQAAFKKRSDSLLTNWQAKKLEDLRLIKVSGIEEIEDPLISIYNQYDIKIGRRLESKYSYSYELAVPIKYLGNPADIQFVYYNIKLPGPPMYEYHNPVVVQGGGSYLTEGGVDLRSLDSVTDFWGQYKLMKK
ncbi:hypothetical protein [Pedobacter frigoris]|uniref:hypothetical protein n=1 Tax=Pedobacter frigoris TaxID=2571272 RepID=UPI002930ED5F|nr:hypothetical protein [Pedobacter frigoris]